MGFGADQLEALAECVELINTGRLVSGGAGAGGAGAGGAGAGGAGTGDAAAAAAHDGPPERLATLADVVAFARRHRVENVGAARRGDLVRLRELRARLDAIAAACEAGAQADAISGLNALLAESGAVPRIVAHDGRGPHIHVSRSDAPLADRIAAHCAMGLAELVVAGEADRVRRCAAPGCEAVFVDLSRNKARRYCDGRTCGNRLHVAAYRSRRSGAA